MRPPRPTRPPGPCAIAATAETDLDRRRAYEREGNQRRRQRPAVQRVGTGAGHPHGRRRQAVRGRASGRIGSEAECGDRSFPGSGRRRPSRCRRERRPWSRRLRRDGHLRVRAIAMHRGARGLPDRRRSGRSDSDLRVRPSGREGRSHHGARKAPLPIGAPGRGMAADGGAAALGKRPRATIRTRCRGTPPSTRRARASRAPRPGPRSGNARARR